jgi:glycosyltransferase involved in cell wall biosynthesis
VTDRDPRRVDILFERAHHPDPRVRRISRALAEAGYRVRVLAWDRSGRLPDVEDDAGVEVRRVHLRSHDGRGAVQLFYLARAVLGYVPMIRADRPSVLHAVDLPMLLAAILIAPLAGRPRIVYDAFEIYSIMESHKYPRWILWIVGWLERLLPRFADVVLTVGEERQAWFRARGVQSTVVANWMDPPADPPTRADARASLGLPRDRLVILYAGGLDPSRDVDALLRHAARAPDDLVVIAGRGSEEGRLRSAAGELANVRFLGFVADPTPVTVAADLLYYALVDDHPYAAHAAPNNLYVAISNGIPLIHRGQGEIGMLAGRHRIGARFHDDATLDAAIDELRDPRSRAAVGEELRGLRERYSWARARAALLSVYPSKGSTTSKPMTNGP